MDFVGDFSLQPTRVNLKGAYAKKKLWRATTRVTVARPPSCGGHPTGRRLGQTELRTALANSYRREISTRIIRTETISSPKAGGSAPPLQFKRRFQGLTRASINPANSPVPVIVTFAVPVPRAARGAHRRIRVSIRT